MELKINITYSLVDVIVVEILRIKSSCYFEIV